MWTLNVPAERVIVPAQVCGLITVIQILIVVSGPQYTEQFKWRFDRLSLSL
jgi:hypothetical protein